MADPATTTLADATPSDWTTPGFLADTTQPPALTPATPSPALADVAPSMRATPKLRDEAKDAVPSGNFFDQFDAPEVNHFDQFDKDDPNQAAALATYQKLAPYAQIVQDSVKGWEGLQEKIGQDQQDTLDARDAVAAAGAATPTPRNFFDQFDGGLVVQPPPEKTLSAMQSMQNAYRRNLLGPVFGGVEWAGDSLSGVAQMAANLLTVSDATIDDPRGPTNPYVALADHYGKEISKLGQIGRSAVNMVNPRDPNRPITEAVGGTVGSLAPVIGASVVGGPEAGAAVGAGEFGSQNYASAIDQGANPADATLAGGVGIVLGAGLPFTNIMRTAEPLVGRTWSQLAYGTLLNTSKAYWEGVGINTASAEATNAVVPQAQPQRQLIWDQIEGSLPLAFVGGISHVVSQTGAELAIGSAAKEADQDKAAFITSTARFMDATANDPSLNPAKKMQAFMGFLAPFSPSAQKAIMAHVQNVRTTFDAISAANDQYEMLVSTNPDTAAALKKEQTEAALNNMQTRAAALDQMATEAAEHAHTVFPDETPEATPEPELPDDEQALTTERNRLRIQADQYPSNSQGRQIREDRIAEIDQQLRQKQSDRLNAVQLPPEIQPVFKAAEPETTSEPTKAAPEEQPVVQSPIPGGMTSDEYAALARHMENSPDPDIQARARELLQLRQQALQEHAATDSEARKTELEGEILAHEAALRKLSEEPQREAPPVSQTAEPETTASAPQHVTGYDEYGNPVYAETPPVTEEKTGASTPEATPVAESSRPEQGSVSAAEGASTVAEQHPAEDIETKIRNAYRKLKGEQGGLSAVSIGKLSREAGVDKVSVHHWLLEQARQGGADLHPTTLADVSPIDKEGALKIPGRSEPAITTTIRESEAQKEKSAVPVVEEKPSLAPTEGLKRPALEKLALEEGHRPDDVKGAKTVKDLRKMIEDLREAKRIIGATETPREDLDDGGMARDNARTSIDPKIKSLPAKYRKAVEAFIKAAKAGKTWGVTKFVLSTAHPNGLAMWADPRRGIFDTIYINPIELHRIGADAAFNRKAFQEERLHNQAGYILNKRWETAGKPGTFKEYYDKNFQAIHDQMTKAQRNKLQETYGVTGMHPVNIGEEFFRQTMQKAMGENLTEDEYQELAKRLRNNRPLRNIVQAVKERLTAMVQKLTSHGVKDDELALAEKKLDELMNGKRVEPQEETKGEPKASGLPARPEEEDESSLWLSGDEGVRPVPVITPMKSPQQMAEYKPFVEEGESARELKPTGDEQLRSQRAVPAEAQERERTLTNRIRSLEHVAIPAEKQQEFRQRALDLARLHFSDEAARDLAESNAFVKVMIEAKKWQEAHGNLDGFGSRRIIQNSLLDDGRRLSQGQSIVTPTEEPETANAEGEIQPKGYDASAQDYEDQQSQFEPVGRDDARLATTETPAKKAQDAQVSRNLQEITNRISPYGRRLLEIWADTPHDPSAAFAPWVSRAAKEFGLPRAKIMADFDALTTGVRREISQRGLTKEDFIRMPGLPKRRQDDEEKNISNRLSSVQNLVYNDENGERTPSLKPDTTANVERGLKWATDQRGPIGRANTEKFADWAEANGLGLNQEAFDAWLRARKEVGAGSEHSVYLDKASQRVVKVTHPDMVGDGSIGHYPDAASYLRHMDLTNRYLGDDQRLEGVVRSDESPYPQFVISQPVRSGWRRASPEERDQFFANRGFERQPDGSYFHPADKVRAMDAVDDNVLAKDKPDGSVVVAPVDVNLRSEGAAYPPPNAPGLPLRREGFAEQGTNDERLKENLRSVLASRVYEQKANQITNDEANAFLAQHGDDAAYAMVLDRLKTGRPTATDSAVAQKLILKLDSAPPEDGASHLKAAELATAASAAGKEFGQFTQAFRMWSKLGSNGVLDAYDKIIRPAIEGAQGPYKKLIENIRELIRQGKLDAADAALDRLDKSGLTAKVDKAAAIAQEENKPIWQRYMDATAATLSRLRTEASSPKVQGALNEFADRLKTNLTGLMREMLPQTKGPSPEKLSATAKLGEVYKNMPEYQQAWDHARDFIKLKYANDLETLQQFEMAMNRAFEAPVKLTDKALNEQMKASGISLRDVAKQWADSQNATRDSLIKAITDKMGLTPEQAKAAGDAIASRFQERLEAAKKSEVAKLLKQSGQNRLANAAPTITDKIFKALNLGAADSDVIWNAVAEKYGLPTYDKKIAQDLARRANEIQKMIADGKEGKITDDKTQDMMNILANEAQKNMSYLRQIGEGEMAIFYGNIFGPSTVGRKTYSEVLNLIGDVGLMGLVEMRHGDAFAVPRAYLAALRGLYQRGGADFRSIMMTGRGMRQMNGDYTADNLVERGKIFGNVQVLSKLNTPLSLLYKPVGRILYGAQAFIYAGAAEARANMIAWRAAKQLEREGKLPDDVTVNRMTQEILGNSPEMRQTFADKAKEEGLTGRAAILRAQELAEQSRPEEIQRAAHDFASRTTFMQPPEGVLGEMQKKLTDFQRIKSDDSLSIKGAKVASRLAVPVTRVVTNVFNNYQAYSPLGIFGAARFAKAGDADMAYMQMAKATAGTLGTLALASMFGPNIQGAGPKDYEKRRQLLSEGWLPYSIKIGDKYYSYREWPVALMMAGIGSYYDQGKHGENPPDLTSRLALSLLATGRFATTSSWIASVSGALDSISASGYQNPQKAFYNALGLTTGALVPFNQSTLKVIDKIFDPQIYPPNSVQGALTSQVAVARRFDNGNAPMLNALGDPIESNPIQAFFSSTNPDPVWNALAEKNIFIPVATKAEKVNGRPITNEEFYALTRDAGQATKQALISGGMEAIAAMDQEQAQHYLSAIYRRNIDTIKAQIAASAVDAGQGATPVGRSRRR